ncbi:MAG: hypothetical protein ACFFC7_15870 [Candidatus Hermodarchaeota archaeon]
MAHLLFPLDVASLLLMYAHCTNTIMPQSEIIENENEIKTRDKLVPDSKNTSNVRITDLIYEGTIREGIKARHPRG